MNGRPRTRSPRLSRTKINKYRIKHTRSFQSQKFDHVFYGIPFDLKDDIIKCKVLEEIRHKISNESVNAKKIENQKDSYQTLLKVLCSGEDSQSSIKSVQYDFDDVEKRAEKLFKNNNLNLYNSVITDKVANNLIKQVHEKDFLKTVFEVLSSEEDSQASIEVESPSHRLKREEEKKQNRAKRGRNNSALVNDNTNIVRHSVDIHQESQNRNLETKNVQREENTAKILSKLNENSVITDNNNLTIGQSPTDILEVTSVTSFSTELDTLHTFEREILEQEFEELEKKQQEETKSLSSLTPRHPSLRVNLKRTLPSVIVISPSPKVISTSPNKSEYSVVKSPPYVENSKRRRLHLIEMMNDYPKEQNYHHPVTNGEPYSNVATLFNMGNTCFLNSVLYTLRFAPTFLHSLHHLLSDLTLIYTKLKENKTKTSSLGRNGSAVSGNSWRSASSKDLLSIGNDIIPKTKDQIVTEKLHALFVTMNNLETKDSPDSYQPEALLQAIRDANPIFEGNHQQDAHEFFVELLSCLRVTCDKLNEQIEQYPELIKTPETTTTNNSKIWGRRSWKKPLKKKEKIVSKTNKNLENDESATESDTDNVSTDECGDSNKKKFGYNFIAEDFQGVSLHRTKCLECEEVSELKEPFLEIQVPVNSRDDDVVYDGTESSIFGSVCVTSEKLCDQNKYFCENCNRYNEALRTVLYEKLPNIMVLHLKRFTTSSSGVQKVTTFVPTPLEIRCFCESCNKSDKSKIIPHRYRLSCVIMHLGASMASGHYIAYSRASIQPGDYMDCTRDIPKNYLNSSGKEINFLKFFKTKTLGNSLSENQNGVGPHSKKNDSQVCQSINCCGIRSKLNLGSLGGDWLEFDDEKVKTLSTREFVDILNRRQESTNTPYLLFYSKVQQ